MKARWWGPQEDGMVAIQCPGCKTYHHINVNRVRQAHPCWEFNGSMESPTFSPSLLVTTGKYVEPEWFNALPEGEEKEFHDKHSTRCHSFIRDGKIQFLGDCTHELANQTVDLPDLKIED